MENFPFSKELTLNNSSNPLNIHTTSLSLTKQNNQIIECRLTFHVTPELYQRIDTEKLFNLKPEVKAPMSGEFLPSDANVMMMDEYLPGIMTVIEGEVEVKEAISLIEA